MSNSKKTPKHLKIYLAIIEDIKNGVLKSNDKIPSTRSLGKIYRCHRLTVMNAMQSLIAEGWLESVARSHYFVSAKIPVTSSKKELILKKTNIFDGQLARKKPVFDLERTRYKIEFWGGQPDLRLFPKDEFRKIVSDSLKKAKVESLNYGSIDGLDSFKKQTADYLRRSRSLTDTDFIITSGSQEALYLIAQVFVKPGDKIAVERKGYPPAWRLFESLGAKIIPVDVDQQGLVTEHLEKLLKQHKIKMIYTTPLHQYPTTATLSPKRRQDLIRLAESYKIPILEDDYDHEFHFVAPPPPPLSTETNYGIYICSFSKILFPGARLGAIGCTPELKDEIAYQKYLVTRQTDSLSQLALGEWMKDGGFERHVRRTTRIYEQRYYFMLNQLNRLKETFDITWHQPNGGMSIWVNLNQNSQSVAEKAKKKGIFFQNESTMDYLNAKGTHLRIGFAGVNESQIVDGFKVLAESLG